MIKDKIQIALPNIEEILGLFVNKVQQTAQANN
jgi:nitrous oxide reductase